MKKSLIVAAMMLLTAAAQAQTITASDVMATYQNAVNNTDGKYCYNADVEQGVVRTQYVYLKVKEGRGRHAIQTLRPHLKYQYDYDNEGRLLTRTTQLWNRDLADWQPTCQLSYTYLPGQNIVECSYWDSLSQSFLHPQSKVVYEVLPNASIGFVSNYHRVKGQADYVLSEVMAVPNQMFYGSDLVSK